MNVTSVKNLILSVTHDFGSALLILLGAVIVIGIGFLIFKLGWGYIRNMPGDWGYDSQRKSYRFGRGKVVKPGANGVIDLSKF